MTLLEAIETGLPFRRQVWAKLYPNEWYSRSKAGTGRRRGYVVWSYPHANFMSLTESGAKSLMHDIMSTDWEVKTWTKH